MFLTKFFSEQPYFGQISLVGPTFSLATFFLPRFCLNWIFIKPNLFFLLLYWTNLFKLRLGALIPRPVCLSVGLSICLSFCLSVLQKLQKKLQNFTIVYKTSQNIKKDKIRSPSPSFCEDHQGSFVLFITKLSEDQRTFLRKILSEQRLAILSYLVCLSFL